MERGLETSFQIINSLNESSAAQVIGKEQEGEETALPSPRQIQPSSLDTATW